MIRKFVSLFFIILQNSSILFPLVLKCSILLTIKYPKEHWNLVPIENKHVKGH